MTIRQLTKAVGLIVFGLMLLWGVVYFPRPMNVWVRLVPCGISAIMIGEGVFRLYKPWIWPDAK